MFEKLWQPSDKTPTPSTPKGKVRSVDYVCLRCNVAGRTDSISMKCWYCGEGDKLKYTLWKPKENI